jgi:hypothetical protein
VLNQVSDTLFPSCACTIRVLTLCGYLKFKLECAPDGQLRWTLSPNRPKRLNEVKRKI